MACGYGVRAAEFIDAGKYFAEYTGLVTSHRHAEQQQLDNTYQYEMSVSTPNVSQNLILHLLKTHGLLILPNFERVYFKKGFIIVGCSISFAGFLRV